MDLGLKGKVAIITGSSRGIGKGIALGLASEGCNLIICARNEEALMKSAEEMKEFGVGVLPMVIDVYQKEDVDKIIKKTIEKFGQIDILVNNVGSNKRNLFEKTTDEDWQAIIDLNLLSHVKVSREAVSFMKEKGSGSIIFISSIFGRESGGATLSIYNTTKAGINALSKTMAVELAPNGIRVNSVAPGSIRFPGGSWDKRCIQDPEGMEEFTKKELPLGRFGTVEEVANVVAFLASDRASLVTGTCINVDGCQSRSII